MSPWSTYTGTKLETEDTAKEHLQRTVFSSTRKCAGSNSGLGPQQGYWMGVGSAYYEFKLG